LNEKIRADEIHLPASTQHQQNFLDAIKGRAPAVCPIDVAVRSDTICQLSYIAVHLGRKLHWDPDREVFVGDDEANLRLQRAMRAPWHL
jgi:hypothetical protein